MKRIVLVLVIAFAVTSAVFAQNYVVQEVTGRVERDAGGGKWTAVKVGDTLKADIVVRTVIGAKLTVKNGDEVLSIGPMKTGKLSEIVSGSGSIQVQGRISHVDTEVANRSTGRVDTASARGSDAAGDIPIEE